MTSNVIGLAGVRSGRRILDYAELMKPELTTLSALTALCGFYLGSTGTFQTWVFVHLAVGTLLVGGGAGALNQYIERSYDALMKRTERRPLPAGRLRPVDALLFGIVISAAGMTELFFFANPLTGYLAALTWSSYLFLYTPLKRVTPLSTIAGGIPGALPPMMGWAAARNDISAEAWVLFAILFCWQMPHFFSLAWMYRRDYARAGFRILTVTDESCRRTSSRIFWFTSALLPLGAAPTLFGMTGTASIAGGIVLGGTFLLFGAKLLLSARRHEEPVLINAYSRRIFFASLLYLPALMLVMSFDKL